MKRHHRLPPRVKSGPHKGQFRKRRHGAKARRHPRHHSEHPRKRRRRHSTHHGSHPRTRTVTKIRYRTRAARADNRRRRRHHNPGGHHHSFTHGALQVVRTGVTFGAGMVAARGGPKLAAKILKKPGIEKGWAGVGLSALSTTVASGAGYGLVRALGGRREGWRTFLELLVAGGFDIAERLYDMAKEAWAKKAPPPAPQPTTPAPAITGGAAPNNAVGPRTNVSAIDAEDLLALSEGDHGGLGVIEADGVDGELEFPIEMQW